MSAMWRSFCRQVHGYILVMSLILMPVFLGFALIIIDIGRGNNAHADLAAAADALALAGARELDGGTNAIVNARAAMAQLANTASMLGLESSDRHINLVYEVSASTTNFSSDEFLVLFLNDIPDDDTTPIDTAFLTGAITTDPADAQYVYVKAQSRNLQTAFFNPANMLTQSVPVGAVAVAKTTSSVCNITPLYICNPFEQNPNYAGENLVTRFTQGDLHGRLLRLHPKGNNTQAPGNFGFLQVEGSSGSTSASANAIREFFAGRRNPTCYDAGEVTTKPGAAVSIAAGINTMFDVWDGPFNSYNGGAFGATGQNPGFEIHTSTNVRKGYKPGSSGNQNQAACQADASDDHLGNNDGVLDGVWGFPDNTIMNQVSAIVNGTSIPGAIIGQDNWDLTTYWANNYNGEPVPNIPSSFPLASSPGASMPSRYDVYLYENANGYATRTSTALDNNGNPGGESGAPLCAQRPSSSIVATTSPDPRIIYAAIVDCIAAASLGGGVNTYDVTAYAELFMVRPMGKNGQGNNSTTTTHTDADGNTYELTDSTIDVEILRLTGAGGNGNLDAYIRDEAVLVR